MKAMKRIVLVILVFSFLSANAFAVPIYFTETNFAELHGQPSKSVAVTDPEITMTFEAQPEGATLFWDTEQKDGIGVGYGYEYDEIEGKEFLEISFSEMAFLSEVYITDLFNEWGYLETGAYEVNESGTLHWFEADENQLIESTNGLLTLDIGENVDVITFQAPGIKYVGDQTQNHEFSIGGVNVAPVPEPSTMLLLGSGLVGLVGLAKKFRKQV